jgi:hypothetical protein
VYTPNPRPEVHGLLPVMVFIHGGAFYFWSGTNDFFGPERFMDYDVVSSEPFAIIFTPTWIQLNSCIGRLLNSIISLNLYPVFENIR